MKDVPLQEWALRLLEDQVHRLAELRNANPRDPGFKLWRQTTLTVIQRVWPGNLQRSERFRRIPFSTPSTKATRTEVREFYERGCAEANAHLKALRLEIQNGGLTLPPAAERVAAPMTLPGETLDLGGGSGTAELLGPDAPGSTPLDRELQMPESPAQPPAEFLTPRFDIEPPLTPVRKAKGRAEPPPQAVTEEAGEAQLAPPPVPTPAPTPPAAESQPSAPATSASTPTPSRSTKSARRAERRALKEMLGFIDESIAAAPPVTPAAPVAEQSGPTPATPSPSFGSPAHDVAAATNMPAEARPADPTPVDTDNDPDPFAHDEPAEGDDSIAATEIPAPDDIEEQTADEMLPAFSSSEAIDFLDRSPVLTALARPRPSTPPAPAKPAPAQPTPAIETESAIATALAGLAARVDRLGVPEGQRAAARAALLDLARQFDERTVSWEVLRDAMDLAMEHPPLARRLVPLLVPFLDEED